MGNEEELSLYEARRREAEMEILGGKRGMITVFRWMLLSYTP